MSCVYPWAKESAHSTKFATVFLDLILLACMTFFLFSCLYKPWWRWFSATEFASGVGYIFISRKLASVQVCARKRAASSTHVTPRRLLRPFLLLYITLRHFVLFMFNLRKYRATKLKGFTVPQFSLWHLVRSWECAQLPSLRAYLLPGLLSLLGLLAVLQQCTVWHFALQYCTLLLNKAWELNPL